MRGALETVEGLPEELQSEYVFDEKLSRFVLKIEDHPIQAALDELKAKVDGPKGFRENNIALLKEKDDLLAKLSGYGNVSPAEIQALRQKVGEFERNTGASDPKSVAALVAAQVAAAVDPLKTELASERQKRESKEAALARKTVESSLRDAAVKAGVADPALPDFLNRGLGVFAFEGEEVVAKDKDGQPVYSKAHPGQLLTPEEWAFGLADSAPHLFRESNGGGAPGGSGSPGGGGGGRERWVDGSSAIEMGKNLEDIASGKVRVAMPRQQ